MYNFKLFIIIGIFIPSTYAMEFNTPLRSFAERNLKQMEQIGSNDTVIDLYIHKNSEGQEIIEFKIEKNKITQVTPEQEFEGSIFKEETNEYILFVATLKGGLDTIIVKKLKTADSQEINGVIESVTFHRSDPTGIRKRELSQAETERYFKLLSDRYNLQASS